MKIDVLRFLAFPDQSAKAKFSRQRDMRGEFKGDSGDIITPIDSSGFGQWKHIKNSQGWPWDLKLYDDVFVYMWVTEGKNGWSPDKNVGPKSFKKFIKNHADSLGVMHDGLPCMPRFVDTVSNNFTLTIAPVDTMYATFENCKETNVPQSLGIVSMTLQGPFMINHGGDIGERQTLIHNYGYSNNGTPVIEQNMYVLDIGWVSWKLLRQNPSTGFYDVSQETVEPLIFAVNSVNIVFPCF